MRGLLTLLWHGPSDAERVLVTVGGGMGSLLGPADGLYHDLGVRFAAQGIGTVRVGYRKPNDLARCVHDMAAAADLAGRRGARRFVTMGDCSVARFAIQTAAVLGTHCRGVITLSTIRRLRSRFRAGRQPLLLFHGTDDEILPPKTSAMVRSRRARRSCCSPGTATCSAERQRSSESGSTNGSRRTSPSERCQLPVSFTSCRSASRRSANSSSPRRRPPRGDIPALAPLVQLLDDFRLAADERGADSSGSSGSTRTGREHLRQRHAIVGDLAHETASGSRCRSAVPAARAPAELEIGLRSE